MDQSQLKKALWYDAHTGLFRWRFERKYGLIKPWTEAGWADGGYTRIQIGSKSHLAHRLAWLYEFGVWPSKDIDHINGNRADNRLCNLRDVSRKINTQNRKAASSNNSCGLLGVSAHGKTGRFVAGIYIHGKRKHLGIFDTAQQAHDAYLTAKRKSHEGCTI